ncbi:MAG: hypothetical protein K8S27_06410 [Candidatus Omnitrophica bacterium]|nr:hypothetical protein [Candidatus Omnitrophota bacterium]
MKELTGRIIFGNGAAAQRFKICRLVMKKYGLVFPPLHFGTINIKLDMPFETPYYGIIIPYHKLDEISCMNKEYWQFIPVDLVNQRKRQGYILRTSLNIHGDRVIELLTEDIATEAEKDKTITVTLTL